MNDLIWQLGTLIQWIVILCGWCSTFSKKKSSTSCLSNPFLIRRAKVRVGSSKNPKKILLTLLFAEERAHQPSLWLIKKKSPFFVREPDHQDIYRGLKGQNYTDQDIIGFYTVRQIPQWVREKENKKDLFKRKIPPHLKHYCKVFGSKTVHRWRQH